MSYDYLIEYLKSLKSIQPDKDFLKRSRNLILAYPKKPSYAFHIKNGIFNTARFSLAISLMALMLLVLGGKIFPKQNIFVASLNNKNLVKESLKANINIQLAELKYYKETTAQVTLALNEIINKQQSNPEITHILKEKANEEGVKSNP